MAEPETRTGEYPAQLPAEGPAPPPPTFAPGKGSSISISTVVGRLSQLVTARGEAVQTSSVKGDISLGRMIEIVMAAAITDTQAESEAIAAETGSTEADQAARIAALNDLVTVRARVMQNREKLRGDWYAAVAAAEAQA